MSGLSSCQNLASSLFFFFLRSAVSGTYRHVATVSGLYPDFLKFKKKKILVRVGYGFGKCLTSTHVGHVSDTGTWAK